MDQTTLWQCQLGHFAYKLIEDLNEMFCLRADQGAESLCGLLSKLSKDFVNAIEISNKQDTTYKQRAHKKVLLVRTALFNFKLQEWQCSLCEWDMDLLEQTSCN